MSGDAMRRHAVQLAGQAASLPKRASMVVRKTTFDTEADAKRIAPVDTAMLRNGITSAFSNNGLTGAVVSTASYSDFVERGTSLMRPQPFMGPATDRNAPLFREAMGRLGEGG